MSQGKRRNGHRPRQRPPAAGAVDLARLKPASAEALEQARAQILERQGMLCPCGERIRDTGVELVAMLTGPNGVMAASSTFHSRDCAQLTAALLAEHEEGTDLVALRSAPPIECLDECPVCLGQDPQCVNCQRAEAGLEPPPDAGQEAG